MEGFGKEKVAACACFMVVYIIAYIAVGTFDNSLDAVFAADDIARHDAEWALSASFEAFAIVGLFSIWVYGIGSWPGGLAIGLLSAFAAGGFHVMPRMTAWLPVALAAGFTSGLALFAIGGKKPIACSLFGVEASLAALQVAFIVPNM